MNLQIRRVTPEQASELTRIALAAKAHWGYPQRWLEIWRPQLTFRPQYFEENEGWVAYVDETLVGFYTLQEKNGTASIENLWVLPEYMGKGVGKALFLHAVELSRERGNTTLQLEADPNAVGFYKRMGMSQIGEVQYELEGQPRSLPIMELRL
ncbi:MAG TPA: GNAT family N-acetyltransferase [Anaerolineales bacterium]|nr:GNAT family N-acetyltransferase [Anaerolineales bacterium]